MCQIHARTIFPKKFPSFLQKIYEICGTKVMPIMNRVWIFNFGITRNLVKNSKNQKISQIYTRKPKISKNFPTFLERNVKLFGKKLTGTTRLLKGWVLAQNAK
jgi:hypothetical protein